MRSKLFFKLILALPILAFSIPAFAGYQVTSQSGDSALAEVVAGDPANPGEFIVVAEIQGAAAAVNVNLLVNDAPGATATFTDDFTLSFPGSCDQVGDINSISFSASPNGPDAYTLTLGGFASTGTGGGTAIFNCPITINAVDDMIDEDSESLNLTITGANSVVKDPLVQSFTIADNDTAGLVATNTDWNGTDPIVISQKLTDESGLTATFWVELATQPTANVTVDLAVSDTTEGLISSVASPVPAGTLTLTFTDANWNTGQQVTITGQADADPNDGNVPYTVSIQTTDETDNKYDNLSLPDVNVVNNNVSALGDLKFSLSSQSGDEGDPLTLTVQRVNGTSGQITVDYSITNLGSTTGADYSDTTVPGGTLTFEDGDMSKDISITLENDTLWEPAVEQFEVTLSNATAGVNLLSPSTQTVSINPSDEITVSIAPPAPVLEGDAGSTPATFVVTYSGGTLASAMTLSWMTVDGSASAGSDYTAVGATNFDLPTNGDPVNLVVDVLGDTDTEGDETFSVQLSESLDLVTLASGGTATATITDDDAPENGTISITSIVMNPVLESGGPVTVTVTRSGTPPFTDDATVSFATADGTAEAGSDYTATSGDLDVFPADGSILERTFDVTILDPSDTGEPDETFTVQLTGTTAGTLGTSSGEVTIIGDPTVTFNPTSYNVGEADGSVTVYVTRANADSDGVSVDYTTTNGSATAGEDYTTTNGTLSWGAGETGPMPINIPIIADADTNGPETFTVDLSNCSSNCTIISAQATVTITEGAPPETNPGVLSFDPIAILVNEATGTAGLQITRTAGTDGDISIDWETIPGSATAPSDFTASSGTVSWTDGSSGPRLISVPITNDDTPESSESFTVRLIPGTETGTQGNPTIGASPATVTIQDNDQPPSAGELSILDINVGEGDGTINVTVTRDGGSDGVASVDFATADGSALAGTDYTATNGTLNWADGDTASKMISIDIIDDMVVEPQETFTVTLSNVSGATIADATADVVIFDNDGGGNFSISDVTVFEIDKQATLTVTRSNDNDSAAYVAWTTQDGTAQDENGDRDYLSDSSLVSGELVWLDGDTSSTRTITIDIIPDTKVEGDEWFMVTLLSVQGDAATISKPNGIVTIKDPVPIPTLSEWAMGLMVLLLMGLGAYALPARKRQVVIRK